MRFTQHYFTEAFSEQDLSKAAGLIKSYLEKKVGKLYQEFGVDYFENKLGKGAGIRYFLENGKSVRLNFANNKEISSVDIWDGSSVAPNARIDTAGMSVVKILPLIVDELKTIKLGRFEVDVQEGQLVTTEAVQVKIGDKTYGTQKEAIRDLLNQGKSTADIMRLANAKASSIYVVKKEMGLVKEVKVFEAGPEKNADPELPKIQQELDGIKYAKIETVFKHLNSLIDMVIRGDNYSLLITGMPGTGKSVTSKLRIEEKLGPEGDKWIESKGHITPMGLYRTLYENNGKLILIDESDDVFKDKDSILILKAALDNKETRKITWSSESGKLFNPDGLEQEEIDSLVDDGKLPKYFVFKGRVIFITNLYQDKIDDALKSRSIHIDITLKRQDIVTRIREIITKIQPNVDIAVKEEVLNFMQEHADEMRSTFDIRTFDKAIRVRKSEDPDWKTLVLNYV